MLIKPIFQFVIGLIIGTVSCFGINELLNLIPTTKWIITIFSSYDWFLELVDVYDWGVYTLHRDSLFTLHVFLSFMHSFMLSWVLGLPLGYVSKATLFRAIIWGSIIPVLYIYIIMSPFWFSGYEPESAVSVLGLENYVVAENGLNIMQKLRYDEVIKLTSITIPFMFYCLLGRLAKKCSSKDDSVALTKASR